MCMFYLAIYYIRMRIYLIVCSRCISSTVQQQVYIFLHDTFLQIIAERKQYHESTGRRYLNFEKNANVDEIIRSIYI